MRGIVLKRREDRRIRSGHLWVFSNEVDTVRSPLTDCAPGEVVSVLDAAGGLLGVGYVNPASLISVRLMTHDGGETVDAGLLRRRLGRALELRERLYGHPYYRLCHAEGDYLPGLVVDRFGDVLSLQLNTAGIEAMRDDVLSVLDDLLHPRVVVLRNDASSRTLEGLPLENVCLSGAWPDEVAVLEGGVEFAAPFKPGEGGQKTGWFFDQRPNRLAAAMFGGRRVLDAFCYAGGFGVTAMSGGASDVTFLDASETALAYAGRNARRADPGASVSSIRGDALTELARLGEAGERYDVVCLDPPAFIKRKKDAAAGLAAYRRVNELGLRLVRDGGVMMTCSCSHHLSLADLHALVSRSLVRHRRLGQLVYTGTQGMDHPVHPAMPETSYLKALAFRVWKEHA